MAEVEAVARVAMAVANLALKVAQDVHAMARRHLAEAALHKVHALIVMIAVKEVLRAHHQTVSRSGVIVEMIVPMMDPTTATWTETMTAAPVVMSCHVTSTPS